MAVKPLCPGVSVLVTWRHYRANDVSGEGSGSSPTFNGRAILHHRLVLFC
jgi:hypothetical protein